MRVPFFRYTHVFKEQRIEIEKALLATSEAGSFIMQLDLREFEQELAEYTGAVDAVGVGNATDALEIIVADAGLAPGDEVILPSHTFVASVSAVTAAGLTPIFAEVGSDHLIDPNDVEVKITERTRAIMPTHLNGRVADMDQLVSIAERKGLIILEDSAQGIGSLFKGKAAGTFGAGGVLSFYPAKVLGCFGDGGAILTMSNEAGKRFRQIRDHGRDPETGEVVRWGRNTRLDNLQAAILKVKLRYLDESIALRRELGGRYHANLSNVPQLHLPPPPIEDGDNFDTFQNYEVEAEERDLLRAYLSDKGIGTILQWGGRAVHQFPGLGVGCELPKTEQVLANSLLLPMNTSVTEEEVDYVCEQIRAYYTRASTQ